MEPDLEDSGVYGFRPQRVQGSALSFTADDFGLSLAVNDAVERAHREGALTAASLMVAGPAAADAVRRARAMPSLRVGLHLVAVEGPAILPPSDIPDLVDARGWFSSQQARLGVLYGISRAARRQLAAEIEAQFTAFAATGLKLGHADAHKHMHLHPFVAGRLLASGRRHGLTRVRVPVEPAETLAACGTRTGAGAGAGAAAFRLGARLLGARVRAAGMVHDDAVFGLAWSGHMTVERVRRLLAQPLPPRTEIYFHPATHHDWPLDTLMPDYEHAAELAALLDPGVMTVGSRQRVPAPPASPARTRSSPPMSRPG